MADDRQQLARALASPIRREILWLVRDRELAAGDIAAAFELRAPTISEHLGVLRRCGLVEVRVDGTFRRYRAVAGRLAGLEPLLAHDDRWQTIAPTTEAEGTTSSVGLAVSVEVDVDAAVADVFAAFTVPAVYTRWLGAPVTIVDGRFACRMPWGTTVRGTYDVVAPPNLIAMRWDFDAGEVPVPGDERSAYLHIVATDAGAHVTVHQHARTDQEARYFRAVWGMVLGRLRRGFASGAATASPSSQSDLTTAISSSTGR
jgi:DNA-binding transcriptional ArsR family regulator/uncharacterized protein YndB with AHSA1/START domain